MRFKILASVALLSVFSTSYAKVIYTSGEWQLEDMTSRNNPDGSCIMSTESEAGNAKYRLEFHHLKEKLGVTEIYLRRLNTTRGTLLWNAELNSGNILSFANLQKIGKDDLVYNIPQHNSDLVAQLDDRKNVKFKPADATRDPRLTFKADGFRRVREKMQEKCLKNAPLLDQEFETSFLINKEVINPANITVDEVKELRRLMAAGYAVHLDILKNKNDVGALGNRFKAQITEANSLEALIERLTNTDIPTTIRDAKNNDDLEIRKKSELSKINSDITSETASVAQAQRALDAADAAIAPFEGEHSSRSQSIQNSRYQVNENAGSLSNIDNAIAGSRSRIDSLTSEAYGLQASNNNLRVDLRDARQANQRANQEYRAFEPRQEIRQRINNDRVYNANRRDVPTHQSEVQALARALTEAKGKLLAREAELRVCQARTASFISVDTYRLPAQARPERPNRDGEVRPERPNRDGEPRPERPNRPGNPTPDPTPTPPTTTPVPTPPTTPVPTPPTTPVPTPTVDCSAQVEAVRVAKAVETDIASQHNVAVQKLENLQSRMNMIENRIEAEVENDRNNLAQRANQTERRVQSIEGTLVNNERRIDLITNQLLPQEQNTLNSLENSRPGVQAQYDQNANNLSRLESELASFERRVGWDAKVQAVNSASGTLSERQDQLSRSVGLKRSTESVIANCQSERTRLSNQLNARQQQKAQSEARLEVVRKSLEPFDQETDRLESVASDLKNQLSGLSVQFENQIQ